jgi:hypothetical protein
MSKRCGKRTGWVTHYFGGQQDDPGVCGKMAPYHVRERMAGDIRIPCDIWLCELHYAEWLEHEFAVNN